MPRLLVRKAEPKEVEAFSSYKGAVLSKSPKLDLPDLERSRVALLDDGSLLIDSDRMGYPEVERAIMGIYGQIPRVDGFPEDITGLYLVDSELVAKLNANNGAE